MKKKITVILLTLALLAGCQSQAPAAPSATDTPDIETIIQQSVDEAVQEKMKEYEEEQRKKDEEIARLKDQLEDLTGQPEVPPEETGAGSSASESQPEETVPSQAEVPSQPEPEPAPPQSTASPASYDPYDLKNMYPSFVWEAIQSSEESDDWDDTWEPEDEEGSSTGFFREEDAQEIIRLTNEEREKNDLPALGVDEDLMELARVRAMEIRELYSHTRPDGTSVVDLRCGENCGQRYSVEEQMKGWMNSEGHRTNILLDRYHHIGAACYQAPNGNRYWVQVFSLD